MQKLRNLKLIFNNFQTLDHNWPLEREEFNTKITYDGEVMDVNATAFLFGGLCEAEITDVIMPKYNPQH